MCVGGFDSHPGHGVGAMCDGQLWRKHHHDPIGSPWTQWAASCRSLMKAEIVRLAAALEEGMRTAETLAKRQRDRRLIEAILVGTDDDLDDTYRVPMDDVAQDICEVIQDLESMF